MKLFGRTTSMTDEEVRAALDPIKIAYAKKCIGGTAPGRSVVGSWLNVKEILTETRLNCNSAKRLFVRQRLT